MSGIISAKPFNDVFPATRDNATMQGFVTAIYEIGMSNLADTDGACLTTINRLPGWCYVYYLGR